MNINKLHLNDPPFYRHIKNLQVPDSVTKSVSDDLILHPVPDFLHTYVLVYLQCK